LSVGERGRPEAGAGGGEPQDRQVDRRAFLSRIGALTAGVAAGAAWRPDALHAEPSPDAGRLDGVSPHLPPVHAVASRQVRPDVEAFWRAAADAVRRSGVPATEPEALTAWEAGVHIRAGRLSASRLVDACLNRAAQLDGVLKAFNTVTEVSARNRAREIDAGLAAGGVGGEPGLLAGIPLAIKDNVHTAGVRTTANAHMFRDFVPVEDATLVARLQEAGGIVLGKTQMGPLATTRALTPDGEITTVNAWAPDDPRVSPGGSSSGSATSVAARMVTSSMGTQTGGSITVPASSQGLTGLKPTMGRVSLRGVIPLTYTRDHPGPLARDARDAALLLQVMAGPDPGDPRTLGLPPVPDYLTASTPVGEGSTSRVRWPTRLGVPPGWAEGSDAASERRRAFLSAMREGGVEIVELALPAGWSELASGTFNAGRLPERSEPFLPWLREDVRLFGVALSSWIQGLLLSGDEYLKAQRARLALLRLALDEVFDRCDVVIQGNHLAFDMIGLPLITFPIGFRDGSEWGTYLGPLPDGVILGGAPFGEERLLAVTALWQARTGHHRARPADPGPQSSARVDEPRGRMGVEEVADQSE
jgi:Asp-tRNA(Asn)/Glu-tRNA(Gln) amidotransferase A subunit family amidase